MLQCVFGGDSDGSRGRRQRGRSRSIVGPPDAESTGSEASSPSDSDSSALRQAEWLLPKPRHRHDHARKHATSPVERQMRRRKDHASKTSAPPSSGGDQDATSGDVGQPDHNDGPRSPAGDDRKSKITWYVEETDVASRGQAHANISVVVADEEGTSVAERDAAGHHHHELPILAPMSARRRRPASWPSSAADAARAAAARHKARHSAGRRPSPATIVATTAVVEPEPETDTIRPEIDTCATDDSGVVDEQPLRVLPMHGERLTVAAAKEATLYRSTGNIAVAEPHRWNACLAAFVDVDVTQCLARCSCALLLFSVFFSGFPSNPCRKTQSLSSLVPQNPISRDRTCAEV